MNREHKYRAWDGTYFYSPIMQGGDIYRSDRDYEDGNNSKDDPLMQYTGLKDKNGTDIYVGDFIKYKLIHVKTKETVIVTCEVAESKYGFYPFTDELYCMDDAFDIEVIGNKFQNPELFDKVSNELKQDSIFKSKMAIAVSNVVEECLRQK